MLIYCPKCKTGYDLEPKMIPDGGKKFRCARCGEIWLCRSEDMVAETVTQDQPLSGEASAAGLDPENEAAAGEPVEQTAEKAVEVSEPEEKPAELNEIFARLSSQTEELFKQDQARPVPQKALSRLKHILGLDHPGNGKYYLLLLILIVVLLLVGFRYELVRSFPAAEAVFSSIGIESRVVGEGLEFQNIVRNEYEEDYVRKLEVKGFIANISNQSIDVPLIHVEVMDKDTNLLQSVDDKAPIASLAPDERMAFRIVINQPSPLAKYILLTFAKK